MTKKQIWTLVIVVVVIDMIMIPPIVWYAWNKNRLQGEAGHAQAPAETLPALYPLPPFRFTDQDGRTVSNEDLKGKAWLAYVFFSTCAGPCPVMNAHVAQVAAAFEPGEAVRFVGFTVDPQYDTPAVLRAYGERYSADFEEWIFLTGESDQLQSLAVEGLKLGHGDTPLIHSEHFVLIDKQGTVRGYLTGTDEAALPKAIDALRTLAKE